MPRWRRDRPVDHRISQFRFALMYQRNICSGSDGYDVFTAPSILIVPKTKAEMFLAPA